MEFSFFDIDGPALIKPKVFSDERGYFIETFRENIFAEKIGDFKFVQENQSYSKFKNTVRGLHFQKSPHGQGKLVRCVKGAINDVFVDIRPNSKTFGQWRNIELSEENNFLLWIPDGFLHGFATLLNDCIVTYRVTEYYMPQFDAGIAYNDTDLAIDWQLTNGAILSTKDANLPPFKSLLP